MVFLRGKTYWFKFKFNGVQIRQSTKQGNQRMAERMESARKVQLLKGEVGIQDLKPVPAFDKAMQAFLAWSKIENRASTHRRYETSSKALLRHFKAIKVNQITVELVQTFKHRRSQEKATHLGKVTEDQISGAAVNRELACLKRMFNWLRDSHPQLRNSFAGVRFFPEPPTFYVLSFEEERSYLENCSQPLRDMATLMVETGMRPEEVYRMHTREVNLITRSYFNPHGKTKAARRRVSLNDTALAIVSARASGGFLFPSPRDSSKPVVKLNHAHDGALLRSGLSHFRLYDLRHTWATRAAQSGMDLVTLAAKLGHSKLDMVLRYVHPTEQHSDEAMQRLEAYKTFRRIAEVEARENQPELVN